MYSLAVTPQGRYFIRHAKHPGLAWSHDAGDWVQCDEQGHGSIWPVTVYDSEEALEDYVNAYYLYPRRD